MQQRRIVLVLLAILYCGVLVGQVNVPKFPTIPPVFVPVIRVPSPEDVPKPPPPETAPSATPGQPGGGSAAPETLDQWLARQNTLLLDSIKTLNATPAEFKKYQQIEQRCLVGRTGVRAVLECRNQYLNGLLHASIAPGPPK